MSMATASPHSRATAAGTLIVAHGVCIVAEIHVPDQSARRHSVRVTTS